MIKVLPVSSLTTKNFNYNNDDTSNDDGNINQTTHFFKPQISREGIYLQGYFKN